LGDRALSHAVDLANTNAVSLSVLVEKYYRDTALSDAVRLLTLGT
jgi:hypothetical protein